MSFSLHIYWSCDRLVPCRKTLAKVSLRPTCEFNFEFEETRWPSPWEFGKENKGYNEIFAGLCHQYKRRNTGDIWYTVHVQQTSSLWRTELQDDRKKWLRHSMAMLITMETQHGIVVYRLSSRLRNTGFRTSQIFHTYQIRSVCQKSVNLHPRLISIECRA
jgi:hypothetical protein